MTTGSTTLGNAGHAGFSERISHMDWQCIERELDERGAARLPGLLTPAECEAMAGLYSQDTVFRRTIVMKRHGFGSGEYRYLAYPLPATVAELRTALYAKLAPVAQRWHSDLRIEGDFPAAHATYLERCRNAGQTQPTPLILKYGSGDYNCLHQDLYGEQVFPLQVAVLLSEPERDFAGGEFVLTEQRPRMQSRVEVVSLRQGDAVVFAVRHRPCRGSRGVYRVNMRHGVSRIHRGQRYTLGIIFHDAA